MISLDTFQDNNIKCDLLKRFNKSDFLLLNASSLRILNVHISMNRHELSAQQKSNI